MRTSARSGSQRRVNWRRVAAALIVAAELIAAFIYATARPDNPSPPTLPDDEAVRRSLGASPSPR